MPISPLKVRQKLSPAPTGAPKYPVTVKNSQGKEVVCGDPKVTRALVALMDLGAVNGGAACHWGGPAAAAEVMSAAHSIIFEKNDWFNHYNFVNDIGHAENGIYALRANLGFGDLDFDALKGFRSIESKLTGHGESHLYPDGVLLSNGPLSSALPQAQGLAVADKLTSKNRITICVLSDGASMEGEAKESFAAIPGLHQKGKLAPFVLIVSDNDTKLSGRITEDSFSMTPTFASMETLGWQVVRVENGNDLQACYQNLEKALELAKAGPVFLWLKTVKGYGVKSTAESKSGGHGFPLKAYDKGIHNFLAEIWGSEVPAELHSWAESLTVAPEKKSAGSSGPTEKMQAGLCRGAEKAAKNGSPVFSVSSDLQGSTGMGGFHKNFPENSLDVGIAESNMVSTAAGMSKAGLIPIVDTFAAFGVTKGNLPLIMSSLSSCPMIAVFSHTGFQDAADGASHQSLTYFSAVSSIPYVNVYAISCAKEGEVLMEKAIQRIETDRLEGRDGESYVFFVGRENFPVDLKVGATYDLGKAQVLTEGRDAVIVSCGPLIYKALRAAEELKSQGVHATVINNSSINHPDLETIGAKLQECGGKLVTVEDHQIIGGMGSQLVHSLLRAGHKIAAYQGLGVKGHFGQSAYEADELYRAAGLDELGIIEAVRKLK